MPSQTNHRAGFGLLKKLQNSIRVFPREVARSTVDGESRRGVSIRPRKPAISLGKGRSAKEPTTRRARRRDDRIGSELVVPSSDDTSLASDISDDASITLTHEALYGRSQKSRYPNHELLVSFHCDSKYRENGEELSQSSFSRALEASFPTIGATVFYENIQDMEKEELNRKKCNFSFDNETDRNTKPAEAGKKNSKGAGYFPTSYPQDSAGPLAADDIMAAMGRGARFRCKKLYYRQNSRNTQKDVEEFLRFCEDHDHSFDEDEDK